MKINIKNKNIFFVFIFSIVIFITVIIALIAYCYSKYSFDYPKEYTADFCKGEYKLFDPNIAYVGCYEFIPGNNTDFVQRYKFAAINGCEDLSFMVCYHKFSWMEKDTWEAYVIRKNGCDVNPIIDYTPSTVELVWFDEKSSLWSGCYGLKEYNLELIKDYVYDFESKCASQSAIAIDSMDAIDEIMAIASKPTILSYNEYECEIEKIYDLNQKHELKILYYNGKPLCVKICFKECDGLMFIAPIALDEINNSYMIHRFFYCEYDESIEDATHLNNLGGSGTSSSDTPMGYYRLGSSMDAFVRQATGR